MTESQNPGEAVVTEPSGEMAETTPPRSFGQRIVAALKLEASLYEEVEHDRGALVQAAGVVALAAVATAIGAAGVVGVGAMFAGILSSFLTWIVWTTLVWLIGVKVFDLTSDFEELLRTLGFVAAPQLLYLLAIIPIPVFHAIVGLVVLGMTVVAFVRAVRQALDVDMGKAILVAALAVVAQILLLGAFGIAARLG
jgi:hypothetical protein